MIAIGADADQFREMLAGFHAMDEHFRTAPFDRNLPVLMGLLAVWYNNFFDSQTIAVLPYEHPKDIQWGSSAPLFFGGAVLDVADGVRQKLLEFEQPQSLNNDVPVVDAAPDAARQLSELSRGSR
jgi:hypothetical protein